MRPSVTICSSNEFKISISSILIEFKILKTYKLNGRAQSIEKTPYHDLRVDVANTPFDPVQR